MSDLSDDVDGANLDNDETADETNGGRIQQLRGRGRRPNKEIPAESNR